MAKSYTPRDTSETLINLTEDPIDFTTTEETSPSPLVNLPTELWLNVFSYLENQDLKELRLSCNYFNDLARFPLMKKSVIKILPDKIDRLSEVFVKDQKLPFKEAIIYDIKKSDPGALQLLDKVFTKHLKHLAILESYIFDWLADKPLPNLNMLFIHFQDEDDQIEFGKWNLGMYQKLKSVIIEICSPNISDPLNLFHDILKLKLNLQFLVVNINKKFEYLIDEIRKIYSNSSVPLPLIVGKY